MFCIIEKSKIKEILTEIEKLGLIVGCLGHDLDHRGFSNSFLKKTGKPLSQLYTTSIMEFHHFDHFMMILNFSGNNICENLTPTDNENFIKIVKHAIISTDLCLYLGKRNEFFSTSEEIGDKNIVEYFKNNDYSRELLRGMLMTACDLGASCKPWEIQKRIAMLVTEEFFQQGDFEKSHFNTVPIEMMDREKIDQLPKLQIDFIQSICLPLYEILRNLFPELSSMEEYCRLNREKWSELKNEGGKL